MPKSAGATVATRSGEVEVYSGTARGYHWIVVALIAIQIPVGLYMAYRGNVLNLWDGTTNSLYSAHKIGGVIIFALVMARLAYRLGNGAPKPEPTLEPWQRTVSEITHWSLYALLLAIPVFGYIGVSAYPALDIFGLFKLPGLVAPDKVTAEQAFYLHKLAGYALGLLLAMHIGAALYHHFVRGDNVLARMMPSLLRRR
ncbi:MAG: cytochrome b [Hyphomicrobiaceae bacterium]|nr:cytochrome b [Hyphomicrobiaceae bacterium]